MEMEPDSYLDKVDFDLWIARASSSWERFRFFLKNLIFRPTREETVS